MPEISLIIATHNQSAALPRVVESALGQSHDRVELVIVNDGSTDDTVQTLTLFRGLPNVTAITMPHRGSAAARNRGLAEAHGELVCFLDAPAILAPTHLEQLVRPFVEDDSIAWSRSDSLARLLAEGSSGTPLAPPPPLAGPGADLFDWLLAGGDLPVQSVLVKRSVLAALGGFAADLASYSDYDLWLRLAAEHPRGVHVHGAPCACPEGDDRRSDRAVSGPERVRVLERILRRHPVRAAAALLAIQRRVDDLDAANGWLQSRWQPILRELDLAHGPARWSLIDHLDEAQVLEGSREQLAPWEVTLDGGVNQTVHLHPPAVIEITIPTGASGRLVTAVAMHPDVWNQPQAGACVFTISVDEVTASATLQPNAHETDKRWVPLAIDVPANADGHHTLRLATRTIGPPWFAWALFRDVRFQSTDTAQNAGEVVQAVSPSPLAFEA